MPLRLITLHGQIVTIIEGITLCLLGVWQGVSFAATSIVSDEDWSKLIGPHGALFAVSVGLVVVWLHSAAAERNRQKRADAAEIKHDKRHAENRADMRELSDKLMALTAESIKANVLATVAQQNGVKELSSVKTEMSDLSEMLRASPCLHTNQSRVLPRPKESA